MAYVEKNCLACDALFSVRVADHKRGWGKFCNKSCAAAYKFGHRPRDVNAYHAKFSSWAKACMAVREAMGFTEWPRAARVKDQIGKLKVKPIYHSPSSCRSCGIRLNGPGLCDECEMTEQALWDNESGWDGHKGQFT